MSGTQKEFQHLQQGAARGGLLSGVAPLLPEHRLGQFQVPIAVFMPSELVDCARVEIEAVAVQRLGGGGDHLPGAGAYPSVRQAKGSGCGQILALGVHQHEPRRVPKLVAEVAVALGAAEIEAHVATRGGQGAEGEAQGVGAVGRDAVGVVTPRRLLNARRQVRLGEVAGALGHQRLKADAVDEVQAGPSPLPLVLDIFWPSASRTRPWMYTCRKGTSSVNLSAIMIMRATQKKMMSWPVTSTSVGWNRASAWVCSGQPRVAKLHSAEENQVSRTSSSCRSGTSAAKPARRRASASSRPTWMAPSGLYQAGMRWPHHCWRLMHQSLMSRIQAK